MNYYKNQNGEGKLIFDYNEKVFITLGYNEIWILERGKKLQRLIDFCQRIKY